MKHITDEYILQIAPKWFCIAFRRFLEALEQYKKTNDWNSMEGPYCEFQSELNVAEVEDQLPLELINYLRDKYI